MILSSNEELNEYELIRDPKHIATVWDAIVANLPEYWEAFLQSERQGTPAAQLAAHFRKPFTEKDEPDGAVLARVLDDAVVSYEREAVKYRDFFDPDALEEFQDDPNAFKQSLSRNVPVILQTLLSKRAELRVWQGSFRHTPSKDLLEVFANVLDFVRDWQERHPVVDYAELHEPAAFGLDPLESDDKMHIIGVIAMGIKSIVLFHLDAERLPPRGRDGLYGLYFLSGRHHFGLPSETSEFLMINDVNPASDGSIVMDNNYWYPYGLFSLYALRLFRWIEEHSAKTGFALDRSVRYVYVARFFQAICNQHVDDLKTMRAHERFEFP